MERPPTPVLPSYLPFMSYFFAHISSAKVMHDTEVSFSSTTAAMCSTDHCEKKNILTHDAHRKNVFVFN